jgi:hypothetical protein
MGREGARALEGDDSLSPTLIDHQGAEGTGERPSWETRSRREVHARGGNDTERGTGALPGLQTPGREMVLDYSLQKPCRR